MRNHGPRKKRVAEYVVDVKFGVDQVADLAKTFHLPRHLTARVGWLGESIRTSPSGVRTAPTVHGPEVIASMKTLALTCSTDVSSGGIALSRIESGPYSSG